MIIGKRISDSQIIFYASFKKAIMQFLKVANSFKIEKNERNHILQKIVDLRKEILKIKHASVIFYDFAEKLSLEVEKEKFRKLSHKEMEKMEVRINVNQVESDMRKKFIHDLPKKFIQDENFSQIVFHLAEIYADYYEYDRILGDIISRKESIHPDLLLTYLAGDFHMMGWHTFDHIDDLVSFEKDELIYVKGLMSNISDFLEKMDR